MNSKLILGIDPGTMVTGYGVIECLSASQYLLRECGVFRTSSQQLLGVRVREIYDEVRSTIEQFQPDVLAVEDVFVGKNARSALMLGHARGVILLAAEVCDVSGLALLCSAPPRGIPAIPRPSFAFPAARRFMGRPFARRMMTPFGSEFFHSRLNFHQREQLKASGVPESRRVARQLAFWPPHVSRGRIQCPVYVGGGDEDPVITPWVTRMIARRYHVVPNIYQQRGHMPNLEVGWEGVGDDLLRWMQRF